MDRISGPTPQLAVAAVKRQIERRLPVLILAILPLLLLLLLCFDATVHLISSSNLYHWPPSLNSGPLSPADPQRAAMRVRDVSLPNPTIPPCIT